VGGFESITREIGTASSAATSRWIPSARAAGSTITRSASKAIYIAPAAARDYEDAL